MSDASDKLVDNDDLLSLLEGDSSPNPVEQALSDSESEEADKKMQELAQIASEITTTRTTSNPGSGDIDQDLEDWFNGRKQLPSDELSLYTSNPIPKMDYGTIRHTLSGFAKMGILSKFLDSSFEIMFDENSVATLMPDELEDRVKLAFAMYKELAALNQRTIQNMKDYRLKSGSASDEIDKLSLLLSSIPEEKLKALLTEISGK
jgi:hypothetical protein